MEVGKFKKCMEMITKIHDNIPFCEALNQMAVYAKFMKELLIQKHKLKYNKNIDLEEGCSVII